LKKKYTITFISKLRELTEFEKQNFPNTPKVNEITKIKDVVTHNE
jgi:hypothetical protein